MFTRAELKTALVALALEQPGGELVVTAEQMNHARVFEERGPPHPIAHVFGRIDGGLTVVAKELSNGKA